MEDLVFGVLLQRDVGGVFRPRLPVQALSVPRWRGWDLISALSEMDGIGGLLEIEAWESGKDVEILIKDNGVGIDPDRLKKIQSDSYVPDHDEEGQGGGIGLRNINERLRYQFGPEYRVVIESQKGTGTTIRLKIPIENDREE